MTNAEVTSVLKPVLSDLLGSSGLLNFAVASGEDHDGEASLFVDLFFEGGHRPVDTDALISAMVAAREVLEARGEPRFPYVRLHIPDPDRDIAA